MKFAIQASNPQPTSSPAENDATLGEAIETVFPLHTEFAFLVWNDVYVPLTYKYDLSVMCQDIMLLVGAILDNSSGSISIDWPSNTFAARWLVTWSSTELRIDSHWRSVIGGSEASLNSAPSLTMTSEHFLGEWGGPLRVVEKAIRTFPSHQLHSEVAHLERLLQRVPWRGVLYAN